MILVVVFLMSDVNEARSQGEVGTRSMLESLSLFLILGTLVVLSEHYVF